MSKTPKTPGRQAVQSLKTHEKSVAEFKVPATRSTTKKAKPKILTEEKYIEELSNIIQRDFYPDLDKLRAQIDYLDAMERKDFARMESIRAKFSGHRPIDRSRSMTPATFETPVIASNCTPVSKTTGEDPSTPSASTIADGDSRSLSKNQSLDSFLQKYTSEDNYSFQELVETAEEKLRQKFAVFYNQEQLSYEKLARALTLPTIDQQFGEANPLRTIETWNYTNMNSIMYIPDAVELTKNERIEAAKRRQTIQHKATRLAVDPFEAANSSKTVSESAKNQNQLLAQKIGVDGTAIESINKAVPQIRGFDLVKTPSPRPGEEFSPLMTWGEIEGTPFRLDGSDTPARFNAGPSFKINESSRRETLALALAEKVGDKMRAQKQRALDAARKHIGSPYIRSNIERLASMSPAGRRLATTKLGLRTSSMMTPSPLRTPNLPRMKAKMHVARTGSSSTTTLVKRTPSATPQTSANSTEVANTEKPTNVSKSTLTDDLLKIPTKRSKAADFF